MAQQDERVVDWAARLRASLAPSQAGTPPTPPPPAAKPEPAATIEVAEPPAARTTLAALSAAAAAEPPDAPPPPALLAAAPPPAAEPVAPIPHELGPLAALLTLAPEAPPLAVPPAEPAAPPAGGLLSFLAQQAPSPPASPIWEGPLLGALGKAPLPPPETPLPVPAMAKQAPAGAQAILAAKPVLQPAALAPAQPAGPAPEPPAKPARPQPGKTQPGKTQPGKPQPGKAGLAKARPGVEAEDPLGPPSLAAAYLAVNGTPMPAEAATDGAEWLGLARSLDQAKDGWRALFLGAAQTELPLAGALAARSRGLAPVLHATEEHPGHFGRLLAALEAKGLAEGETRLLQAAVAADPARLPPRGALAQELLERQAAWDYVRLGVPRVIIGLLRQAQPLLDARVRWLLLRPETRAEEAAAIKALGAAKWRLVAERPARLRLGRPITTAQPGVQLWRGPLA
ncbi:hypothetical protein [Falsiroseomonas sp.]|uniref:hypothetical protein n=1 Tax=Falsiroseomonas sp. TaxID=2870721 RepID=UPI003F700E5F